MNSHFAVEWRDPQSGEVIAEWTRDGGLNDDPVLTSAGLLMRFRTDAKGDGLRLVKISDAIRQRITALAK